eukprot:tig00021468_g21647.t1
MDAVWRARLEVALRPRGQVRGAGGVRVGVGGGPPPHVARQALLFAEKEALREPGRARALCALLREAFAVSSRAPPSAPAPSDRAGSAGPAPPLTARTRSEALLWRARLRWAQPSAAGRFYSLAGAGGGSFIAEWAACRALRAVGFWEAARRLELEKDRPTRFRRPAPPARSGRPAPSGRPGRGRRLIPCPALPAAGGRRGAPVRTGRAGRARGQGGGRARAPEVWILQRARVRCEGGR